MLRGQGRLNSQGRNTSAWALKHLKRVQLEKSGAGQQTEGQFMCSLHGSPAVKVTLDMTGVGTLSVMRGNWAPFLGLRVGGWGTAFLGSLRQGLERGVSPSLIFLSDRPCWWFLLGTREGPRAESRRGSWPSAHFRLAQISSYSMSAP